MRRPLRFLILALATALVSSHASALTLLTADKVGVFRSPAGGEAEAVFRIGPDRALASLPNPGCPAVSSLRFALSRRGADFEDHGDVGAPKLAGAASWNAVSQQYTLAAGGVNMWGPRDELHFVWRRLSGDFILQTRVEFEGQGSDPHRKAGVLVRASLDDDSPYVDAVAHGAHVKRGQTLVKLDTEKLVEQIKEQELDAPAAVIALEQFRTVNAKVDGDSIVYHQFVNLGIAVASDAGLVVPNIKEAHRMGVLAMAKEIVAIAERARDGKLTIDDLTGGTFTITNGGVFGSLMSTPILNPPQVGILGLHTIKERPVGVSGQVVLRPMMYLALSYDHRIVDGVLAARFLRELKALLEQPLALVV